MDVILGKNCLIDKKTILGYQLEDGQDSGNQELRIGDAAVVRSGSVIYYGTKIGNNFHAGHNIVIREGNLVGDDVAIGVGTYLGPRNSISDDVKIHTNCFIESAIIEQGVALGPNVVLTNDLHPRCPSYKDCVGGVTLKKNCVIGANATILPGIIIGEKAIVGAGSVVTKNVEKGVVVAGNPAKKIKDRNELKCVVNKYDKPYDWK